MSGRRLPRAPWLFALRNLPRVRGDRMGIFADLVARYGDAVAIRLGPALLHVFNRPEYAQHILQTNHKNYRKDPLITRPVEEFSGQTMFTSDGDEWVRRRRVMQPAFRQPRLARVGDLSARAAERMLARWRRAGDRPLDMQTEMARVTLEVVGRALFSIDLTEEAPALGEAFVAGNQYVIDRIDIPVGLPLWVPTRRNRRFLAAKERIDAFLFQLIDERGADAERDAPGHDLVAMLLAARDEETGARLSRQQLRNEMIAMFSAGHDTTASTLMWALYLLSQHPAAEARLQAEVDAALGDRLPTMADLDRLPFTHQVIQETMRLYPSAWAITRRAIDEDQIGEWAVAADDQVTLPIAALHRHPEFWQEPDAFRPERFSADQVAARHRFAYMPFGAGPRRCIGNAFARVEAALILATLARRVSLRLVPGHVVQTKTVAGLHARYGIAMTRTWRRASSAADGARPHLES